MDLKISHLLWGVLLFCLYILLDAVLMPMMRLGDALAPSQMLALIAASEAATQIPFLGVIWREWSIVKGTFSSLSWLTS